MMKKLVIDVENTTTKLNDKYTDYSPYNPGNKLVSIGWAILENGVIGPVQYLFVHHKDLGPLSTGPYAILMDKLNEDIKSCSHIIAHNAKYDVSWLEEAGFDLSDKKIEDTMIREYVMARGRTDFSFRLADTCKRYGVAEKGELFEKYPDLQISEMPIAEVEEYGRGDIQACAELYVAQEARLNRPEYLVLHKTVEMMNEFCRTLVNMERNGVCIDVDALDKVDIEFTQEAEQLKADLNELIKKYMGDTQVNLESPQQLSEVIYSRRIKSGQEDNWLATFNIGKDSRGKHLRRPKMSYQVYATKVKELTQPVLKTNVKQCPECNGNSVIQKLKKDGTPWKRTTKCKTCDGKGAVWEDINEIAGFKMKPNNIHFTTISGFSTSQGFLDELIAQAEQTNKPDAKVFLEKLQRLSSVSSYLSNFVGGIRVYMQKDNSVLHPNFNQCITATGRLSSTRPNLQNQPREATFPIRKVFVSRWKDGEIAEVDFAQLEFRAAIHLARDNKGKEDILNGIDVHNQTAKIITEAGQPIGRQDAKSRTFKPLYGGTSGTEAERAYYRAFLQDLYRGVGEWHKKLQEDAIKYHIITIQTGRQFIFPDVERAWHGGATMATRICNYPVQAFATADVVPISIIRLEVEMGQRQLKSKIVLTVHDSVVVDIFPGEKETVLDLLKQLGKYAEEELNKRYDIELFVPLTCEVKYGNNLMTMKKVA